MLRTLRMSLAKGRIPSMTTTLIAPTCARPRPLHSPAQRAVLTIHGMPRHLRLRVEELMAVHLSPPAAPVEDLLSTEDIWDTVWFTRWHNDSASQTVGCREVLVAPAHELAVFRARLLELAETFRFQVSV